MGNCHLILAIYIRSNITSNYAYPTYGHFSFSNTNGGLETIYGFMGTSSKDILNATSIYMVNQKIVTMECLSYGQLGTGVNAGSYALHGNNELYSQRWYIATAIFIWANAIKVRTYTTCGWIWTYGYGGLNLISGNNDLNGDNDASLATYY